MSDIQNTSCEKEKERLLEAFLGGDISASSDNSSCRQETEAERAEREQKGLLLFTEILNADAKVFESTAFEILGNLILADVGVVDKVAELMMDKNPAGYVNAIFKAADRCTVPYVKFALVRAVFRRYPGRYRPYILSLGRELIASKPTEHTVEVTLWLLRKFGSELVPDLVSFIQGECSAADRVRVMQEAVLMLGKSAGPLASAAAESQEEELRAAGTEAVSRLEKL